MSQDTFGFNPLVLHRSAGKRFVEGVSGRSGLTGLLMWMQQLDFVEGVEPLLNNISSKLMFYDTALTKCAKEVLKRPEFQREEEIAALLGYSCGKCGLSQAVMSHREARTCKCGEKFKLTYLVIHKQLRSLNIIPTPEAVLMTVAYDGLADAYVEAFQAFRMVLEQISINLNWNDVSNFIDTELKDQLDSSFLYLQPGDTRQSMEQREILMFLVRGNVATKQTTTGNVTFTIGLKEAEDLIRLGIATVKYGHLCNQLYCAGADLQYFRAREAFSRLYNVVNEKIRLTTSISRREREKRAVTIEKLETAQFYPCALLPSQFWSSGKLAQHLIFKPIIDFPTYTTDDAVAMNCCLGPSGCGKSTLLADMTADAVFNHQEVVLNILGDEKNSLTLSCIPAFPCEGKTGAFLEALREMGILPQAIPCLNLVFMRKDEKIKKEMLHANPPTIFDRIVEIDEPWSFGFKLWNSKETKEDSLGVINILEEFALAMGYKHVCGIINTRNLRRIEKTEAKEEFNRDVEIATVLMNKFVNQRPSNKFPSMRVNADELSYLAPSTHSLAGSDTSKSSTLISTIVKMARGLNCSIDTGSQKWTEINSDVRAEATNILFRELPQTDDKNRSQRDVVLGSLSLKEGKAEREMVASMMEKGTFPHKAFHWFWWNKHHGRVEVVKPSPPPFMINQPKKTNLEVFRAYEKFSGQTVLLKSWDEVPILRYENDEVYVRRTHRF